MSDKVRKLKAHFESALGCLVNTLKKGHEEKDPKLRRFIQTVGKKLCLYEARYKCESCENNKGLTLHHLISRINKGIMSKHKYTRLRYDYKNQVILCSKCHEKIEYNQCLVNRNMQTITEEVIRETKEELEEAETIRWLNIED